MGLLTDLRHYLFPDLSSIERRDWLTDDDEMFEGPLTTSGVRINRSTAMRVSTVLRCVKLLSDVIATLPKDVVVAVGGQRFTEYEKPGWILHPDPSDPSLTDVEHFSQVVASMALDGDFFTYVPNGIDPLGGAYEPAILVNLDPRYVEVKRDGVWPVYELRDELTGQVKATIDRFHMLHGSFLRMPGQARGLSPIEAARQGIGLALAAEDFGSRFFGQGAALSYGVEVPGGLTAEQREQMEKSLRRRYAGTARSHAIGVLTGGAKFVTGLGVTNEQAQFLELRQFTVEDIARLFGIPPHLVGSQEPGASSYNSVEQRTLEFGKFNVAPFVSRITAQYTRLVTVPENLRSSNARATFAMDLRGLERADIKTRYESYQVGVLNGILKPDEARSLEDLPPVEGGNQVYMQAQMVPLGTVPAAPAPARADPVVFENHTHVNAESMRMEPVFNVPPTIVNPTPIEVNVETPAPMVTIAPPEEERSNVIKLISRDENGRIVTIHEKRGREVVVKRIERDEKGRIAAIEETA